jgi:two-component system response regulator VanR
MISNFSLLKDKTILFAEDDAITRIQMEDILSMIFGKVIVATDGMEAYRIYTEQSPDMVLTDIKMPNIDGISLIKKIRQHDYKIPIILLTSFIEDELIVNATNLSIDGYLVKPIDLEKMTYTLCKAIQRTAKEEVLIPLTKDDFYNIATQELYRNGIVIELGAKERMLVQLLIDNPDRTLTKEEIGKALWPLDPICNSAIKNIVLRVRKKLNIDTIVSVRGIGYRVNLG